MDSEKALSVSLEEFGLSSYEARAYIALVSKGTISASELSFYSDVPRTKVYPILLKLEKKRLVIISKSKPIMCTAIAPEDAFDEIVQEQIEKVNAMNALVSNLKKVSEESKKSRGSEEKRYFHLASNNVLNQLKTMLDGVKTSVNIIADQWGLGLLVECKEQLISILRRNIEVKIIIPPSQIGSESFKRIPNGVKTKVSEFIQNCFILDQTELLVIDSSNGKGATFSSTDILGANQMQIFSHIWKNAIKTDCLSDMSKSEAQEIYRIIKLVNDEGLSYFLNSSIIAKDQNADILKLLEKSGFSLKTKTLDEILDIIDSALQIMCSGHVNFDAKNKHISVESRVNSGHSLPWVSILEGYLLNQGYKTRMVYQTNSHKGEKIHIKISS